MPVRLPEEIVEFIAAGVDVSIATRDRELEPETMFAMGVKPSADRTRLTVYLPTVLAQATLDNLADNQQIAVTLERPIDLRAVQIKGRSLGVRPSGEADRELQAICRAGLVEQLSAVGVPRCLSRRLVWWPSVAVEVEIAELFQQTPGPRAGAPLSEGGA